MDTPTERPPTERFPKNQFGLRWSVFSPSGRSRSAAPQTKYLSLTEDQMKRGVITASSGNHGLAVAYVTHKLKIEATIVLPENVIPEKKEMIESLGARTVLFGRQQDERMRKAEEIQNSENLTFIQPFNDVEIITGQGTCGLELMEDVPEIQSVFVPIGGGGLISGVATAIKLKSNHVRVIGVQPEGSASMYKSFKSGTLYSVDESHTIADGLSVRKPGDITFSFVRKYVNDIVLVNDEEIISATAQLIKKEHVLTEPSGRCSSCWTAQSS